jgi:hypothetical protein
MILCYADKLACLSNLLYPILVPDVNVVIRFQASQVKYKFITLAISMSFPFAPGTSLWQY